VRPANLIPTEQRERRQGIRSAPLAYLLVGALLIALGAVTLMVVTDNQIATRKNEVVEAKRKTAAAEAVASQLTPYTQFHSTATQRTATITNLANSRFDWVKVMRQLAVIQPRNVWLSNLTGTVRPDVSVGGGESIGLRATIPGPALSIAGCATGQEAVADFVASLKDIDGVTRVGLQSSGGNSESASASGAECGNTPFQLVVAFDAAPIPVPIGGSGEELAPEVPAPVEGESESTESTEAPEGES
jgi:Tfp pilus assembly protein PilN